MGRDAPPGLSGAQPHARRWDSPEWGLGPARHLDGGPPALEVLAAPARLPYLGHPRASEGIREPEPRGAGPHLDPMTCGPWYGISESWRGGERGQ